MVFVKRIIMAAHCRLYVAPRISYKIMPALPMYVWYIEKIPQKKKKRKKYLC